MSNIQIALVMTVVGMGIVFIGILILWGVMALMVRIWPHDKEEKEVEMPGDISPESDGQKAKAAAVAVAVAMSLRRAVFSSPVGASSGAAASSWQVTTRALEINQGTQSFTRKPRGNGR